MQLFRVKKRRDRNIEWKRMKCRWSVPTLRISTTGHLPSQCFDSLFPYALAPLHAVSNLFFFCLAFCDFPAPTRRRLGKPRRSIDAGSIPRISCTWSLGSHSVVSSFDGVRSLSGLGPSMTPIVETILVGVLFLYPLSAMVVHIIFSLTAATIEGQATNPFPAAICIKNFRTPACRAEEELRLLLETLTSKSDLSVRASTVVPP